MNIMLPETDLNHHVRDQGHLARDARQISRRLRKLLPVRLQEIKNRFRPGHSAAKAERLALTDPTYIQAIKEYLDIQSDGHEARIQYETHLMLVNARKSLRVFRL